MEFIVEALAWLRGLGRIGGAVALLFSLCLLALAVGLVVTMGPWNGGGAWSPGAVIFGAG